MPGGGKKSLFDWNVLLLYKWYYSFWNAWLWLFLTWKMYLWHPSPLLGYESIKHNGKWLTRGKKKKMLYKAGSHKWLLSCIEPKSLLLCESKHLPIQSALFLKGLLPCLLRIFAFYISLFIPLRALSSHTWRNLFFLPWPRRKWLEGSQFPWPGIERRPQQWKHWILTTRPPGNSIKESIFLNKGTQPLPIGGKMVFQLPPGHFYRISWPKRGFPISI